MTDVTHIPQQTYVDLFLEDGLSIPEIAEQLGRNLETVRRALRRAGTIGYIKTELPNHDEVVARAQLLRDEGMPINWIVEDLGVSRYFIVHHTVTNPTANKEWKRCWSRIRHDPDLMDLHRLIAPKNSKS